MAADSMRSRSAAKMQRLFHNVNRRSNRPHWEGSHAFKTRFSKIEEVLKNAATFDTTAGNWQPIEEQLEELPNLLEGIGVDPLDHGQVAKLEYLTTYLPKVTLHNANRQQRLLENIVKTLPPGVREAIHGEDIQVQKNMYEKLLADAKKLHAEDDARNLEAIQLHVSNATVMKQKVVDSLDREGRYRDLSEQMVQGNKDLQARNNDLQARLASTEAALVMAKREVMTLKDQTAQPNTNSNDLILQAINGIHNQLNTLASGSSINSNNLANALESLSTTVANNRQQLEEALGQMTTDPNNPDDQRSGSSAMQPASIFHYLQEIFRTLSVRGKGRSNYTLVNIPNTINAVNSRVQSVEKTLTNLATSKSIDEIVKLVKQIPTIESIQATLNDFNTLGSQMQEIKTMLGIDALLAQTLIKKFEGLARTDQLPGDSSPFVIEVKEFLVKQLPANGITLGTAVAGVRDDLKAVAKTSELPSDTSATLLAIEKLLTKHFPLDSHALQGRLTDLSTGIGKAATKEDLPRDVYPELLRVFEHFATIKTEVDAIKLLVTSLGNLATDVAAMKQVLDFHLPLSATQLSGFFQQMNRDHVELRSIFRDASRPSNTSSNDNSGLQTSLATISTTLTLMTSTMNRRSGSSGISPELEVMIREVRSILGKLPTTDGMPVDFRNSFEAMFSLVRSLETNLTNLTTAVAGLSTLSTALTGITQKMDLLVKLTDVPDQYKVAFADSLKLLKNLDEFGCKKSDIIQLKSEVDKIVVSTGQIPVTFGEDVTNLKQQLTNVKSVVDTVSTTSDTLAKASQLSSDNQALQAAIAKVLAHIENALPSSLKLPDVFKSVQEQLGLTAKSSELPVGFITINQEMNTSLKLVAAQFPQGFVLKDTITTIGQNCATTLTTVTSIRTTIAEDSIVSLNAKALTDKFDQSLASSLPEGFKEMIKTTADNMQHVAKQSSLDGHTQVLQTIGNLCEKISEGVGEVIIMPDGTKLGVLNLLDALSRAVSELATKNQAEWIVKNLSPSSTSAHQDMSAFEILSKVLDEIVREQPTRFGAVIANDRHIIDQLQRIIVTKQVSEDELQYGVKISPNDLETISNQLSDIKSSLENFGSLNTSIVSTEEQIKKLTEAIAQEVKSSIGSLGSGITECALTSGAADDLVTKLDLKLDSKLDAKILAAIDVKAIAAAVSDILVSGGVGLTTASVENLASSMSTKIKWPALEDITSFASQSDELAASRQHTAELEARVAREKRFANYVWTQLCRLLDHSDQYQQRYH